MEGIQLTDEELSEEAGCARTSLYRMPVFMRIRGILKALGKNDLPRGSIDVHRGGNHEGSYVEAWADPRHDEDEDS